MAAGNSPTDVVEYSTPKTIGYMFLIGFTGIFAVTALRKIFIIDYKLAYPSGTATGVLINSLHTPAGAKRVSVLCCALLCSAVLRCAALCCAVLRCAALCCAALCCTVLVYAETIIAAYVVTFCAMLCVYETELHMLQHMSCAYCLCCATVHDSDEVQCQHCAVLRCKALCSPVFA